MADDERLLELLEQALAPEPAEPSPERVVAVRLLAEQSRIPASRPAGRGPASRPAGRGPASRPAGRGPASRPAGRGPASRPAGQDDSRNWSHRAGWVAAGVSVAAAAVVIAMLAVPTLVGSGHDTTSSTVAAMPPSVARLRVALLSGNAIDVARADANLLREAKTIAGPEQSDAVAAHVEAIQFLRDHPSAAAAAELPPPSTVSPVSPAPPSTTIAPGHDPGPSPDAAPPGVAPPVPVPTTQADGPPNVAIMAVAARLDGTFDVEFAVSGFTPDASGAPGSHSVKFSFDNGRAPTVWDGPSPWSFPLSAGVTYRQVCARVADAAGVEDPSTGGCHDIV